MAYSKGVSLLREAGTEREGAWTYEGCVMATMNADRELSEDAADLINLVEGRDEMENLPLDRGAAIAVELVKRGYAVTMSPASVR